MYIFYTLLYVRLKNKLFQCFSRYISSSLFTQYNNFLHWQLFNFDLDTIGNSCELSFKFDNHKFTCTLCRRYFDSIKIWGNGVQRVVGVGACLYKWEDRRHRGLGGWGWRGLLAYQDLVWYQAKGFSKMLMGHKGSIDISTNRFNSI